MHRKSRKQRRAENVPSHIRECGPRNAIHDRGVLMSLSADDKLAIPDVLHLYAHLHDTRQSHRVAAEVSQKTLLSISATI